MSPESEAHLVSLGLSVEVRNEIETRVAFLSEMLDMDVRDVYVWYDPSGDLELSAFWNWGVGVYKRHGDEPATFRVYPLPGHVMRVSFFGADDRQFPNIGLSLLPNHYIWFTSSDSASDHLKALFRSYVLPHLPTPPVPRWHRPSADDDQSRLPADEFSRKRIE